MIETTQLECNHCQQPVVNAVWNDGYDQVYCCYGCKVVFELLNNEKSLLQPGSLNIRAFLYLDEPKIQANLLDFKEGNFSRISLHLPAIHCSSCIYLLETLPEVEDGILEVQVHFGKKQANITFKNDALKLSQLAAILEYIGYAPDFQTKLGNSKKNKNKLLVQLGVAGFFFGNTMLLALPEYFDSSLAADANLQQFFRYLMFGFCLPVISYSAKDYFKNALKALRAGILSIDLPIALGISVLFLRSCYEVFSGLGSGYFDSLSGLVFFLLIGKWYQQKTYQNFTFDRDFKSFIPLAANILLPNETEQPVPVEDLQKGDIIFLRNGEVLPADAILKSEVALLDYSYITGEALPVEKRKGESVFAGARIKGKAVKMEVSSTVDRSYLSSLWNKSDASGFSTKNTQALTDKVARYFTPLLIGIALVSAIVWSTVSMEKAITVFTAILIVACPCALALAEPFAAGSMMRWFGEHGFFLKNTAVLNRLQEINYVVFDKTGTLTEQNSMQVKWTGDALSFAQETAIFGFVSNSTHPLSSALVQHFKEKGISALPIITFEEYAGKGILGMANGKSFKLGSANFVQQKQMQTGSSVFVKEEETVLGYFSITQQNRRNLKRLLKNIKPKYALALLSGDNAAAEQQFKTLFGSDAALHFNQSPYQKLHFIENIQQQGKKVLMLGDGLNDAGALQQSNVGISLCEKNVNFFPASDALLLAESFGKLDKFLRLSKLNKKIVHRAFALSFLYNLGGLAFAISGLLSPLVCAILMPVSSVSVVVFTTLASRRAVNKMLH